jgi:hypothetical protein
MSLTKPSNTHTTPKSGSTFNTLSRDIIPKKNKKKVTKLNNKDTKGYWEASFTQRGKVSDQLKEQNTKAHSASISNCDHKKIQSMRVKTKTYIELLIEKKESGKYINKGETIQLNKHFDDIIEEEERDMIKLNKMGIVANVTTLIARIVKLLMIAKQQLLSTKIDRNSSIYYIYRKIKKISEGYSIPPHIMKEYKDLYIEMEKINKKVDTIKEQFTKYYGSMPPLDNREFNELDDWQKDFLNNIDNMTSTLVQASTSAGKSILTGSIFLKEGVKALVIVPTDPLCLQTAAMIGKIIGKDIPIITRTFKSRTERKELLSMIERCGIVVGTPTYLLDYLPLLKVNFDWIVIDEIHMIGKKVCSEMEHICKRYNNIPTILLSATIGNVELFRDWFLKIGHSKMNIIKCDKRFFNLQKFYYKDNTMIRIHPLSNVIMDDIKNGNILNKTFNATPPDIWMLATNLIERCDLGNINPYKYFSHDQVITLDEANEWFICLLKWMVCNYNSNKVSIEKIINSYKHNTLQAEKISIYDLSMHLKRSDMTPALIFHTNSHECLDIVREFSRTILDRENEAHPDLRKIRLRESKEMKDQEKKIDKMKIDELGEKQMTKILKTDELIKNSINCTPLNEPHPDFIFNKHQIFTEYMVEKWNKELIKFFPSNGSSYHYIIDLLWRGVGVYVKGLPDAYLHIVQNLACAGKLGIVFSDESLVFGVSMPFRTSVITRDNIDSMMYHQMAGRAGRRGLDKEGNVVFIEYSWDEIQKLSTSSIPNIIGCDTMIHGLVYANKLSEDSAWNNIKTNFLLDKITNDDAKEFYDGIEMNLMKDGAWNFANNMNKEFLHMCWKLRNSEDCFRVPFILSYIRKIFVNCNPTNLTTQIEFTQFILQFIEIHEATDDIYIMTIPDFCKQFFSKEHNIHSYLDDLELGVPKKIDSRVYCCIQLNSIIPTKSSIEKSNIRERLFKVGEIICIMQNYFFHLKEINISRLLAKLLTRIWWIYHVSSPVMDSINKFISTKIEISKNIEDSSKSTLSEEKDTESDEEESEEEESDEEESDEEESE